MDPEAANNLVMIGSDVLVVITEGFIDETGVLSKKNVWDTIGAIASEMWDQRINESCEELTDATASVITSFELKDGRDPEGKHCRGCMFEVSLTKNETVLAWAAFLLVNPLSPEEIDAMFKLLETENVPEGTRWN